MDGGEAERGAQRRRPRAAGAASGLRRTASTAEAATIAKPVNRDGGAGRRQIARRLVDTVVDERGRSVARRAARLVLAEGRHPASSARLELVEQALEPRRPLVVDEADRPRPVGALGRRSRPSRPAECTQLPVFQSLRRDPSPSASRASACGQRSGARRRSAAPAPPRPSRRTRRGRSRSSRAPSAPGRAQGGWRCRRRPARRPSRAASCAPCAPFASRRR